MAGIEASELDEALNKYPHQALHARLIRICHPRTGQMLTTTIEAPAEFRQLLGLLREDMLKHPQHKSPSELLSPSSDNCGTLPLDDGGSGPSTPAPGASR